MRLIDLRSLEREEIGNSTKFRIVYVPSLDKYFMTVTVFWIVWYERWYELEPEDVSLFQKSPSAFALLLSEEISQGPIRHATDRFVGASILRDYDGCTGFEECFPAGDQPPHQGFVYEDGIFWAHIVWKDKEVLVPPKQILKNEDGEFYCPLREICEPVKDRTATICYARKEGIP